MITLAEQIGKKLREAREAKQMTQEEAGQYLGIGRAGYANIETGRSMLTLDHLLKLPAIFDRPVTFFLGIETDLGSDEAELLALYRSFPSEAEKAMLVELVRGVRGRLGRIKRNGTAD